MSSNICRYLLTKIFPKLVLGVVLVYGNHQIVFAADVTCPTDHPCYTSGQDSASRSCSHTTANYGGLEHIWTYVIHVRDFTANSGDDRRFYKCNTQGINGGSSNSYYRVTHKCSESNNCQSSTYFLTTSGDGNYAPPFHLEYTSESCAQGRFACVRDVDQNGHSVAHACSALPHDLSAASGSKFDISATTSGLVVKGDMYYGGHVPSGYTAYCSGSGSESLGCYAYNTKDCYLEKTNHPYGNCTSGTAKWLANEKSAGTAYTGFKLKWSSPGDTNITYTCTTCATGYVKVNNGVYSGSNVGCTCNTEYHWDCTQTPAHCIRGYYISSTECSVSPRPNFDCDATNGCRCRSGFAFQEAGYATQCGPDCKENFQPDGEGHCICDENMGYIWVRDNDNPENDACVLNTSQVYVDQTGWFTLSSDGSNMCLENWWEQENNN